MDSQIIRIESDSEPGKFYEVNPTLFTCSCPYHNRRLRMLPLDDPHRLCKHLVKLFADQGVPDIFKAYEEEIKWFAKHNASFTSRDKALTREKQHIYEKAKSYFTHDQIVVLSRNKKRKYYYIEAKAIERQISATMRLDDGDTSLKISNSYAFYSFVQNTCSFPDSYRFMAPAIILWLDIEYSELTGEKRFRSEENIVAIYNQMANPRQEVAVGAISTVSREIRPSRETMIEWGEWTDEGFDCNLIRAHVDIEDKDAIYEPTEIEAIIPVSGNFLLFRINLSPSIKLFIQEIGSKIILSTSYEREEDVSSVHGWGIVIRTSETTDHEFPKRFSYIKRAIFARLEAETLRTRLKAST
jgi:hypothetical protein